MSLPQRKRRFPAWCGGRSFSSAERLLLALWLSLLLHGLLLLLPLSPGSLRGEPAGTTMRLTMTEPPARSAHQEEKAAAPPQQAAARTGSPQPGAADALEQARSRLGLEVYYPIDELDRPAEPLEPLALPDWESSSADDGATLLVYIDENGVVDRVKVLDSHPPALAESVTAVFSRARFAPALKDGRAVKSFKRVRIVPQPLPAGAGELSH